METRATISGRKSPSLLWLLLLVPLFTIGVQHDFWAPDEPREAETAREIYASGDWVVPRLNGYPFLEKPPLAHWGAALTFHALGGPSEKWCRLPSAFWGLASALAAAWLGTMIAGRRAGLIAAFILTTNVEWAQGSRMLIVDMPLAAAATLSLAFFWYGYTAGDVAWKRLGYLGCAVAAGVAFLAKGTIGIILPGCVFFAFLLWRREWRELGRLVAPLNVAACAACVLPWLVLLHMREGAGALRVFIWDNQVLRFFSGSADHAGVPWFYLERIAESLIPWAILLPPALLRLVKPWGNEGTERRARQFLMVAILVPFVVLSAASGKRVRYLLPLIPVFSIVIAVWLVAAWDGARERWETYWRVVGFASAALVAVGSWCLSAYLALTGAAAVALPVTGMLLAVLFAALASRHLIRTRGRHIAGLTVALISVAAVAIVLPPLRVQLIDGRRSYGGAMAGLVGAIEPGDALYGYEVSQAEGGAIAFHLGATFPEVQSLEELERVFRASPRNVVYVTGEVYDTLQSQGLLPAGAEIVVRYEHNRGVALLLRGAGPADGVAEETRE